MDGVFLLSILIVRPFSRSPTAEGRTSGFGLLAVADPGGGLDVAIASSLVFECELVDRGKLEGRLVGRRHRNWRASVLLNQMTQRSVGSETQTWH
jgi:hypothetical protein